MLHSFFTERLYLVIGLNFAGKVNQQTSLYLRDLFVWANQSIVAFWRESLPFS